MLSAVIPSQLSYPAMLLAEQLVHQRLVRSDPLVLGVAPLKNQRLQQIGDQPVLRRFEPSSRILLIGEQPNPWDLILCFPILLWVSDYSITVFTIVANRNLGASRIIETFSQYNNSNRYYLALPPKQHCLVVRGEIFLDH